MILLAWFDKQVSLEVSYFEDVIHLCNEGSRISAGTQTNLDNRTEIYSSFYTADFSFKMISDELALHEAVWSRWVKSTTDIEIVRQEAVVLVSYFVGMLVRYSIRSVFFHTASPHHYDSSLLYAACQVCGVPAIFFRTSIFDRGFVFAVRRTGVSQELLRIGDKLDRRQATEIVEAIVTNAKNQKVPTVNTKFKEKEKSIIYFFIMLCLSQVRYFLSKRKLFFGAYSSEWSFIDQCVVATRQRSYLTLYNREVSSDTDELANLAPILCIAAHYQPEASSVPDGALYSNHLNLVVSIKNRGFSGQIHYAEHPATSVYWHPYVGPTRCGLFKNPAYLRMLKSLDVNFAPVNNGTNSNILHGNNAIVTITGNVAIERALMGLMTVVAGSPWFEGMPGVIKLDDIQSFDELIKNWPAPNADIATQAKEYLIDIIINCMSPNSMAVGQVFSQSDAKESSNIVQRVLRQLDTIG